MQRVIAEQSNAREAETNNLSQLRQTLNAHGTAKEAEHRTHTQYNHHIHPSIISSSIIRQYAMSNKTNSSKSNCY